jgi:hypothetical protein
VARGNLNTEPGAPRWFVDLDWYRQNARSFAVLAQGCLCPRCRERLGEGKVSEAELTASIRDCCSQLLGFINGELTILASVFRLLLANGNEPLSLAELARQLGERLGEESYRALVEVLSRLLENETYYGIRQVPQANT